MISAGLGKIFTMRVEIIKSKKEDELNRILRFEETSLEWHRAFVLCVYIYVFFQL